MLETEMDFGEIQDLLFRLICQEDPEEAKKMGILPGQIAQAKDLGVGKIEEDEEAEQGLEYQVSNLVQRYCSHYENQ